MIVAALFTYNLTLKTGAMENVKRMLAGVSRDKRVLALIIGWGFGNFMEGMAGFGTAVAIPASMLAAIGLDPMSAVLGCLVVNSTPTAFGSVGVPTVTLSSVTGTELVPLAGSIVNIQCILTFLSPFLMVCICGKGIQRNDAHYFGGSGVFYNSLVHYGTFHWAGAAGYHRLDLFYGMYDCSSKDF